jgi:hypothetical protein
MRYLKIPANRILVGVNNVTGAPTTIDYSFGMFLEEYILPHEDWRQDLSWLTVMKEIGSALCRGEPRPKAGDVVALTDQALERLFGRARSAKYPQGLDLEFADFLIAIASAGTEPPAPDLSKTNGKEAHA